MTAAEDGSVKVSFVGKKLHKLVKQAFAFDRTNFPTTRISGTSQHTASLSCHSPYVSAILFYLPTCVCLQSLLVYVNHLAFFSTFMCLSCLTISYYPPHADLSCLFPYMSVILYCSIFQNVFLSHHYLHHHLDLTQLSVYYRTVAVWDNKTGKISSRLEHTLNENDSLDDVICYSQRVVTITKSGVVFLWDLENPEEPIENIEVTNYQQMVNLIYLTIFCL